MMKVRLWKGKRYALAKEKVYLRISLWYKQQKSGASEQVLRFVFFYFEFLKLLFRFDTLLCKLPFMLTTGDICL